MPPRERQKLQPRTPDVLGNVADRYYKAGNLEGMRRIGQELQDRIQNHPSLQPGTGGIFNPSPMEGGPIDPGSFWNVGLRSGDNTGIMAMVDNRTSINPNTWHQSPYFGIAGFDFAKDHAPEYLDYFQEIKDKDAMARDAGFYPYANPSWIENNPSYGLDYMADILGGKGRVGFRKGLDDDYNAYANWEINW